VLVRAEDALCWNRLVCPFSCDCRERRGVRFSAEGSCAGSTLRAGPCLTRSTPPDQWHRSAGDDGRCLRQASVTHSCRPLPWGGPNRLPLRPTGRTGGFETPRLAAIGPRGRRRSRHLPLPIFHEQLLEPGGPMRTNPFHPSPSPRRPPGASARSRRGRSAAPAGSAAAIAPARILRRPGPTIRPLGP
jgi:hypothetical protein